MVDQFAVDHLDYMEMTKRSKRKAKMEDMYGELPDNSLRGSEQSSVRAEEAKATLARQEESAGSGRAPSDADAPAGVQGKDRAV